MSTTHGNGFPVRAAEAAPAGAAAGTAPPAPPKDPNVVNLEVNGVPVTARKGQMIIEVTDAADIYVPRFCYHPKLTIAANCRMCLIDVEKAPKPLPACATPVAEGMKVFTRSKRAISAQKATMEFLLINHPLDCPICDQGGECELQDLAMGYGRGVSRYTERKRVVKDKNIGPLVSTDMTRCIQCTRCVRFGQEIAGIQELGALGRHDRMEIGTYVEKSVDHELSGNIIDLCPVGALNNKPYRYQARAWEMNARPLVGPHDCAGSNLFAHVLRGTVRRIVPRENEDINETWISDRDRYSCYGIYSDDRLLAPRVKVGGEWREVSWQDALAATVGALRNATSGSDGGAALGVLASPSATLEEHYLLGRIARHLGTPNIDHRVRGRDFRDQDNDPKTPWLGIDVAALDVQRGVLVVGSNLRMEVPIFAHRLRKAALKGAAVAFVNPASYTYHFPVAAEIAASLEGLLPALAGVLAAAVEAKGVAAPPHVAQALADATVSDEHRAAAAVLTRSPALLLLGHIAQRHPRYADLRALAAALAEITGARLSYIAEGANGFGAALAGVLPHRGIGGAPRTVPGLDARAMLERPRRAYLLHGLEPDRDFADAALARRALAAADAVVALTPYASASLLELATVLLPIGTFAETAGTFVNAEGRWQSFDAAASTVGESRPGWRLLRVLGNELEMPECEYRSAAEIAAALERELGGRGTPDQEDNTYRGAHEVSFGKRGGAPDTGDTAAVTAVTGIEAIDVPIYAVDAVVRRSDPLQQTAIARRPRGGI